MEYADIVAAVLGGLLLAWIADLLTGRRGFGGTSLVSGVGLRLVPGGAGFRRQHHGQLGLGALGPDRLRRLPGRLLPVPEQALMPPRARRFVAAVGVLVFLIFWVWGLIALRGLLPASPWIDFLFFGVGGTAWGLPLIPLLKWAERG